MLTALLIALSITLLSICCAEKGRYRRSPRNPARRYCEDCGQQQDSFCHSLEDWDNSWWEPMGEIKDPKCNCHKDTKWTS